MEELINQLTGEAWEEWVDLNYRLGQDPTLYGAADHLLYIGCKEKRD
jgi:S-adenosylmethionine-dependent methyltransferase